MAKSKMKAAALQNMIVSEVRKHPSCGGFESVQLTALGERDRKKQPANWTLATYFCGTAPQTKCEPALFEIIGRCQKLYDIIG